jgi:hypothetical protein
MPTADDKIRSQNQALLLDEHFLHLRDAIRNVAQAAGEAAISWREFAGDLNKRDARRRLTVPGVDG